MVAGNATANESDHLPSGYSMPFEVPTDIIATNRSDLKSGEKLSDYLTTSDGTQAPLISVKSGKGQTAEIFDLGSLVLKEHFNYISTQVHTKSGTDFKGIMGLAERTVSDLFLPDGIYTLWSRDSANPVEDGKLPGKNLYGVHPFYMAKATDDRWFGVYTNLAAAQDWKIKNDNSNGNVDVTVTAAGGLGDLYFLTGATPEEVTMLYHEAIVGRAVVTPQWALGWN